MGSRLWSRTGARSLRVAGLLWSGGYGTPRKPAGAAQGLERLELILAMSIMWLGGALFPVIVLCAAGSLARARFPGH